MLTINVHACAQAKKLEDLLEANRDLAMEGRARRMECRAHKMGLEMQCKANKRLLQQIQALRRERELQKIKHEARQTRVQVSLYAMPLAPHFAVPTCLLNVLSSNILNILSRYTSCRSILTDPCDKER